MKEKFLKIINQSHEILKIDKDALKSIEKAARVCYKSEKHITEDSAKKLVKKLNDSGHGAMLEFADMTVKFTTNRGVLAELSRHRVASLAVESTRYVNYKKKGMVFIRPVWCSENILGTGVAGGINKAESMFIQDCLQAELRYNQYLACGWTPEKARECLPHSLKTEIVMKANLREWQHVFNLRCSKKAHPQIRILMKGLLGEVHERVPVIFDDLYGRYIEDEV